MKLDSKEVGEDIEMDMSPMIDMVFLLLIFFIVASQIIDDKPKVMIPSAAAAVKPPTDDRLMITVTKDDPPVFFFRMQEVKFEELAIKIQQEFEANPELRMLIRADAEVPYKTNERIMKACAEVGAVDIIFSATEESGQ